MVLNGINYTEKHLTDEEMAVVEAMRMGADVQATFYESTKEAYEAHHESLKNVLKSTRITDCSASEDNPFIAYEMKNADYGSTVLISHHHHLTKKAAE